MKKNVSRFPQVALLVTAALLFTSCFNPALGMAKQSSQVSSAYDLIAMVNSLRSANGLPSYKIDDSLMAAAQTHSEYQAANGITTHTGAGGSTPKGRAIAFGYGGGATVFVSENIASGTQMTESRAVEIWQADSLHLNTMLSQNYTHIGAGVATDGNITYFTLDVGYIAGEQGPGGQSTPTPSTPQAGGSPTVPIQTPKGFVVVPVVTVTPMPDGSIIHTVQPGEVLLNIAIAYNIKLSELLQLNYLTDNSVIYPGQKLKIKSPDPTATSSITPTQTRLPTATRRPTRTPTHTPLPITATPGSTPGPVIRESLNSGVDPLMVGIMLLILVGAVLVGIGIYLKRQESSD